MSSAPVTSGLPPFKRFITTHDAAGRATFDTSIPEEVLRRPVGDDATFALPYATDRYPVDFGSDVARYRAFQADEPGIVVPGGSVLRVVDLRPGAESPFHRTVSLDYGVVLAGEVDLELDDGETRVLRTGDICVQRGTMHLWRNKSKTEWARMLYVLQESKPVVLQGGRTLGEDYGQGMDDVKKSGN